MAILTIPSFLSQGLDRQAQAPRIILLHPERLRARSPVCPPPRRPNLQRCEEHLRRSLVRLTQPRRSIWRSTCEAWMVAPNTLAGGDSQEWRRTAPTTTYLPHRIRNPDVQPRLARCC
jgi:hypothetical protein